MDWRATARRSKLTVKDFQTSHSQRLIFLLDCGRLMTNESRSLSLLDYSLNAALMLSYVALRQGDSVGMVCFADRILSYVPPKGGMNQMNQLLHASFDRHAAWLRETEDQLSLASLLSRRADLTEGEAAAALWLEAAAAFRQAGAVERAQVCEAQAFDAAPANREAFDTLLERAKGDPRRQAELLSLRANAVPAEAAVLLKPDVEEELSKLIGDTPAHQALRFVRMASGFGRRAMDTGVRNVAEYFAHERGDLVPRAEAEDFYRGVERLREDLDRLDARTRVIEQASEEPEEDPR